MTLTLLRYLAEQWLKDIELFSRLVVQRPLYAYQLAPARAIVESVLKRRGLEFAVMFPRQAGKNETQAQVEAYLLNVFQHVPGMQIVQAQPTFKPQAQNAMERLKRALTNDWNEGLWKHAPDYMVRLGEARCTFYSAEPHANVVGATANLLLMCDEAQEVQADVWERKFVPMAVSANATIVHWGTAWTRRTLLAQRLRQLRGQEALDGIRRVFVVSHEEVAQANPHYAEAVRRHVARMGRQHPLIKTQYFNEELEEEGGLFPPERRAKMQGAHPPLDAPRLLVAPRLVPGDSSAPPVFQTYALLLDVGGEDLIGEQLGFAGEGWETPRSRRERYDGRRDATALTIVEVDLSTLADPLLAAPTYRAVHRRQWVGVPHVTLMVELRALIDLWQPAYVLADVSGVGHGLGSILAAYLKHRPGAFRPVAFNATTKSEIGWGFLAVCDTGRWQEWREAGVGSQMSEVGSQRAEVGSQMLEVGSQRVDDEAPFRHPASGLQSLFWRQLAHVQFEIRPGARRAIAWGVPDGTHDPETSGYLHDDLVISAALCARLDGLPWHAATGPGVILAAADPLEELSKGF